MVDSEPASWVWYALLGISMFLALIALTAQSALASASRPRLRILDEAGVPGAGRALRLLDEQADTPTLVHLLVTVGIGGAAASLVVMTTTDVAHSVVAIGTVLASGATVLVLGSLARAVAAARPEPTLMSLARPLQAMRALLFWCVRPLRWLEDRVVGLVGSARDIESTDTDEGLRLLVESVEDTRKLQADEREMIHGIFVMSERPVREVMVPRVDVVWLPRAATLGDVLDRIVATGYSRLPIVSETSDDVVGIVYAKDVLRALRAGALGDPAEPLARTAYYVPDTKKVDELLQDLQQKRVHLAIVVDEYGGTAGLVTIEDLLEEIVGEIHDEYDVNEEQPIVRVDATESVVDARVPIRDVNEALDLHLSDEEFDTLGGLVYHELGKVPSEGDEVRVNGCLVTVVSTQGRRIRKLRVRIVSGDM